jgi:hypothetical protein
MIFEELKAKQPGIAQGKVVNQSMTPSPHKGKKNAADKSLQKTTALREATVESSFAGEGQSMLDSEGDWSGNIVPGDAGSAQTWDFSSAVDTD